MLGWSTEVAAFAVSNTNRRLSLALQEDALDFPGFSLVSFLYFAFIIKTNQANIFPTLKEKKFLRKMAYVPVPYRCEKQHGSESQSNGLLWGWALSVYQHRL